jgi:hypothetical protein
LLLFSVFCDTGTYSVLKVIYFLLVLKSLLWGNIVYTMVLIVEVVIWDRLILCPRWTKINTNQMIVDFMGVGLKLHIPQTTLRQNQVPFLVWSRYSVLLPPITFTDSCYNWNFYFPVFTLFILRHCRTWNGWISCTYFFKFIRSLEI